MKIHLIKKPIITEKSLLQANRDNTYTFEVDREASKTQIQKAIEKIFEVEVLSVNTVIRPSKRKRVGKKRKMKLYPAKKKALVKLKEGQTIDLFDLGGEN